MPVEEDDDENILYDQAELLTNRLKSVPKSTWCRKFFKTVALSLAFLALGLCIAIPGPTLIDLQEQVNTDTKYISYIFTARSAGYLVGSILGGILFDKFDQKLLLCMTLFFTAVGTAAVPWCKALIVLALMISLQGISMGVLDTGGNVYCIQIWGKQGGPYMQMLHFFFGIGAFLAPLVAKPFLSVPLDAAAFNNTTIMTETPIVPIGNIPILIPDYQKIGGVVDGTGHRKLRTKRDTILHHQLHVYYNIFQDVLRRHKRDVANNELDVIKLKTTTTTAAPKKPTFNSGTLLDPKHSSGKFIKDHLDEHKDEIDKNNEEAKKIQEEKQAGAAFDKDNPKIDQMNTSKSTTTTTTTPSTTITTTSTTTTTTSPSTTTSTTTTTTTTTTTPLPLSSEDQMNHTIYHKPIHTVDIFFHNTIKALKSMSKIQFAYLIISVFLFCTSVLFLGLYCHEKNVHGIDAYSSEKVKDPSETRGFRVQMLVLMFIFYFLYVGMEVTFGGFIHLFTVKFAKWTKDDGVIMTAIFWGALAAGRGIAIFVAKCCRPFIMLVIDLLLVVAASAVLSFGVKHYHFLLWPGTLVLGLGMSSIFPTGISWIERYMKLTGKATAVFVVGSALGEMCMPALTGYFFEMIDHMSLMYIMLAMSILAGVIYIIMQNIASNRGDRHIRRRFLELDAVDNTESVEMMNRDDVDLFDKNLEFPSRKRKVRFNLEDRGTETEYQALKSSEEE